MDHGLSAEICMVDYGLILLDLENMLVIGFHFPFLPVHSLGDSSILIQAIYTFLEVWGT